MTVAESVQTLTCLCPYFFHQDFFLGLEKGFETEQSLQDSGSEVGGKILAPVAPGMPAKGWEKSKVLTLIPSESGLVQAAANKYLLLASGSENYCFGWLTGILMEKLVPFPGSDSISNPAFSLWTKSRTI